MSVQVPFSYLFQTVLFAKQELILWPSIVGLIANGCLWVLCGMICLSGAKGTCSNFHSSLNESREASLGCCVLGLTDDVDLTAGYGIFLWLSLIWFPQTENLKMTYWSHSCDYFKAQMFVVSCFLNSFVIGGGVFYIFPLVVIVLLRLSTILIISLLLPESYQLFSHKTTVDS